MINIREIAASALIVSFAALPQLANAFELEGFKDIKFGMKPEQVCQLAPFTTQRNCVNKTPHPFSMYNYSVKDMSAFGYALGKISVNFKRDGSGVYFIDMESRADSNDVLATITEALGEPRTFSFANNRFKGMKANFWTSDEGHYIVLWQDLVRVGDELSLPATSQTTSLVFHTSDYSNMEKRWQDDQASKNHKPDGNDF